MPTAFDHGRMRAIGSGIAACLLLCLACPTALAEEALPRSILVIDPANVRGPFYYTVFSGLRAAVNERPGSPVTIYAESLDLSRFGGADYEENLQAHFQAKYRGRPTAETFLDRGGIGGFVLTPSVIGKEAARLALRILSQPRHDGPGLGAIEGGAK
jgi:hypothetical protein